MANYCTTKLVFEGDKAELDEFEAMLRRLEAMEEKDFPVNDVSWGSKWLGFIVYELGENWEEFNCKGTWYDLSRLADNVLALTTESAWSMCDDILNLITDKWPSLQYYYYAEEQGCDIFETNDVEGEYFPQRFYLRGAVPVKGEDGKEELVDFEEYLNSEEDVIAFVNDKLHHPISSLDDIETWDSELQALNEEKVDDDNWEECFIYVNEIEVLVNLDFDDIEPIC